MIRAAEKSDIPALVELSRAMQEESSRYKDVSFNANVMKNFLDIRMEDKNCCVFVSEEGGNIVGMIGGMICPYFFSLNEGYSSDLGLYVTPEMRGGRHAYALISAYESWALEKGIIPQNITLGLSATNDQKAHEFFRRLGYVQIGALYRKGE